MSFWDVGFVGGGGGKQKLPHIICCYNIHPTDLPAAQHGTRTLLLLSSRTAINSNHDAMSAAAHPSTFPTSPTAEQWQVEFAQSLPQLEQLAAA